MVNIWTGFVTADSGWVTVTLKKVQNLNRPIKKKTGDGKTRILKLKTSQKKFACSHVEVLQTFQYGNIPQKCNGNTRFLHLLDTGLVICCHVTSYL